MLAAAKINLFLHVGPIRSDGYHDLASLVVFTDFGDLLTVGSSQDLSLDITGPFAAGLQNDNQENLVLQAAKLLASAGGVAPAAQISLEKNIPIAAGVGGGSSDAAAALRALNAYWSINLDEAKILDVAIELGADVPVCYAQAPAWMEGIGEVLAAGPEFDPFSIVLANPNVPLSTGPVFRAYDAQPNIQPLDPLDPHPTRFDGLDELIGYLQEQRNDLEQPAIGLCPEIEKVQQALDEAGAVFVRMSGSGPTCFGIFSSKQQSEDAAQALTAEYPGWWFRPATTL